MFEIRLGVYATEAEATRVVEAITALLCPDPEHPGPCPVPWSVGIAPGDDELYAHLHEQARIESTFP